MKTNSLTLALVIAFSSASGFSPAWAEDIGVEVEVVDTKAVPQVKSGMTVKFGSKSDASKVSFSLSGFEPKKTVLFTVSPDPDAIARFESDAQGSLKAVIELPYGLEPGPHDIDVLAFFGEDDTSALYTVGRIFVNDFGILTESDGSYPAGTKPVRILLPTAVEQFPEAPSYVAVKGTLRVGEPQVRIDQRLLPNLSAVMSFNNDTNIATGFEVEMTLVNVFGQVVGEPYYVKLDSLAPQETQAVLLEFQNLPPLGLFTLKTRLILPDDFNSDAPVRTSYASSIFVPPLTLVGLVVLILTLVLVAIGIRRKSLAGGRT